MVFCVYRKVIGSIESRTESGEEYVLSIFEEIVLQILWTLDLKPVFLEKNHK